jgi:hypothetical protein
MYCGFRASLIGAALIFSTGAYAIDLSPHYVPHQQTDSERLQTFQPPPPPPKTDTILDKAARAYENAPVRPSFDPANKVPTIEYNKRF